MYVDKTLRSLDVADRSDRRQSTARLPRDGRKAVSNVVEITPSHPESNVDQPNECRDFDERADDAYASPEFRSKAATMTAIVSSKLLPAAVKESVAG